jgi:Glycosyltransferase sugar-binding region containing DXD motif/Alpha 1,4-glycosyltransferase conserved region
MTSNQVPEYETICTPKLSGKNRGAARTTLIITIFVVVFFVVYMSLFSISTSINTLNELQSKATANRIIFHLVMTLPNFSTLNSRCFESIFYFHPDAHVKIHTNEKIGIPPDMQTLQPLQALMDRGYRIEFVPFNSSDVLQEVVTMKDSIVNPSYVATWSSQISDWRHGEHWFAHESDLIRLCAIYLEGGIYIDTDVVLVRPMYKTYDEKAGLVFDNVLTQLDGRYESAVMKFVHPGNIYIGQAINNYLHNYDSNEWDWNGPGVFNRVSQEYSGLLCPSIIDSETSERLAATTRTTINNDTCWMQPLPLKYFQPVMWWDWDKYCFSTSESDLIYSTNGEAIITAPDVFTVHLNNQINGDRIESHSYVNNSVCDLVMSRFCILCD